MIMISIEIRFPVIYKLLFNRLECCTLHSTTFALVLRPGWGGLVD